MRLGRKRWIALSAGLAIFLAAFGIAFASHGLFQTSDTKDGAVRFEGAAVLPGGSISVWEDADGTVPIEKLAIVRRETHGDVRHFEVQENPTVWIRNDTDLLGDPMSLEAGGTLRRGLEPAARGC